MDTLTSALTGAKMATTVQLPGTAAGKRPLPKALLPKAAKSIPSPPVMGGTVFGQHPPKYTPTDIRRGSFSCTPTQTLAKPITPGGNNSGSSRPHSASVSAASTLRKSLSGSISSELSLTPGESSTPDVGLRERESSFHRAKRGTEDYSVTMVTANRHQSVGHAIPSSSWYPTVVRPVRRREPVVQDSIYPMLRAALGKDLETADKRTEEEINRQVFCRSNRSMSTSVQSTSPRLPSTPSAFAGNIYSSMDDVFTTKGEATPSISHSKTRSEVLPCKNYKDYYKASSKVATSGESAIPIEHVKFHSEVVTMAEFEQQLCRQSMAVSNENILEYLKTSQNIPEYLRSSSNNKAQEEKSRSYKNHPASNFSTINSTGPPPSHPPSSILPNSPPSERASTYAPHTSSAFHLTNSKAVSTENIYHTPLAIEPRRTIHSPRKTSKTSTSREYEEGGRSSTGSSVFFGQNFSLESYPLLAKVDKNLLGGEFLDDSNRLMVKGFSSRVQTCGADSRRGVSQSNEEEIKGVLCLNEKNPEQPRLDLESNSRQPLSPPPQEFRDGASSPTKHNYNSLCAAVAADSLPPDIRNEDESRSTVFCAQSDTTSCTFNTQFQGLSIKHQATDSINTEDSGLDRWGDKEGNDQSADEMDNPGSHSMTGVGERTSTSKRRSVNWREDQSEGRGSTASSPRPHSNDDLCLSPKVETYSDGSPSTRHFTEDNEVVPSNSFLGQLLAENSRQISLTSRTLENSHMAFPSTRKDDPLTCPIYRPPAEFDNQSNVCNNPQFETESNASHQNFDTQSSVSNGGIDTESIHSFSTAVQSSVVVSDGTVEPEDHSRSSNDNHDVFDPTSVDLGSKSFQADHSSDVLSSHVNGSKPPSWHSSRISEALSTNYAIESQESPRERAASEVKSEFVPNMEMEKDHRGVVVWSEDEDWKEMIVEVVKGPVGVGFCIEGGKGSLAGDRPILVKRLFKGGSFEGTINLIPGDEIVSIEGRSLIGFSHFDAWKHIKALPNGTVRMVIRRRRNQLPV